MFPTLLLLLGGAASAAPPQGFGSAQLVDGRPDFSSCVESAGDCQRRFFQFLSASMIEQGFAMQANGLSGGPLSLRRPGWTFGGALSTFPFAPPRKNLSGKEENTSFSPVFPRIEANYTTELQGRVQRSLGGFLLPPIPVNGAGATLLGVEAGQSWGDGEGRRFGVEADLSYLKAIAPIAATEQQLADRDSFSNPNNLDPAQFDAVCGPDIEAGAAGCLDRYSFINLGLRAGISERWGEAWLPYAKLGLNVVNERLHIKYDDTTWGIFALQPSAHAGVVWAPGEHLQLGLGGSGALRQRNQSVEDKLGLLGTLEGSFGWTL